MTEVGTNAAARGEASGDAYARAGVDLSARDDLVSLIKQVASKATRPEVMGGGMLQITAGGRMVALPYDVAEGARRGIQRDINL